MNVSTENPSLVSYYIDVSFHTTWIICGPDHFKLLKGEDGIKFAISDHHLSLPKVEVVSIKELLEYFKVPGAPVNVILGRDFINSYSFFFYKRTRGGFQLSKSCLNRCKWPEEASSSLEFYTASYFNDETKEGGAAAFINICSPFNVWRPYKASYWNHKEDIGFFAMIQAMKIATQMPIFHPAPMIHLTTSDAHTCEKYSPFLKVQLKGLETCGAFKNIGKSMQGIVELFLKYRKKYADRTGLEELSCVHIRLQNKIYAQESLTFANQLARLGAGMSEIMFKGELPQQPGDEQYYHFDKSSHVFTASKKQTNEILKKILYNFQQYQKLAESKPLPSGVHASDHEVPVVHGSARKKAQPSANLPTAQNIQPTDPKLASLDIEVGLRELKSKLSLSAIYPILDRLKAGQVSANEKASTFSEVNNLLQNIVKDAEEQSLSIVNRQRHNCDIIMSGAYAMHDEINIDALKAAARLQGYFEGYFEGLGHYQANRETNGQLAQVAAERLTQTRELPNGNISNNIISSIDSRFARLANIGAMLREKVNENTLKVNYLTVKANENADKKRVKENLATTTAAVERDPNTVGDRKGRSNSELIQGKNTENQGDDNRGTKSYTTRTTATTLLRTEGRRSRMEAQCNGLDNKNQEIGNQIGGPRPAVGSEMAPHDLEPGHKGLNQANVHPNMKNPSAPDMPTCQISGPHNKETPHKIPTRLPRGALCLANIGGVPGVSPRDDCKGIQPPYSGDGTDQSRPEEAAGAPQVNGTYRGITSQQRAQMTTVSGWGIQKSLERPIISIQQALESSPDLRETLAAELNDFLGDSNFSLGVDKDGKLKCEVMCTG